MIKKKKDQKPDITYITFFINVKNKLSKESFKKCPFIIKSQVLKNPVVFRQSRNYQQLFF